MARTIKTTVYQYDELSEYAQEKAREWMYRAHCDGGIPWADEGIESAKAFCDHFGVKLTEWPIGPWESPTYSTNAENNHFRGVKLRDCVRDHMPTGYCIDCDFFQSFYDEFKRTGDAKAAFDHGLWKGFLAIRDDMECRLSDESLADDIRANEYEFTEEGKMA